jgi:hypothetical protein
MSVTNEPEPVGPHDLMHHAPRRLREAAEREQPEKASDKIL